MGLWKLFPKMGKSAQNKLVAQKIAARVAQRDSWSTWHTATPSEVFGMVRKLGFSMSPIPPPSELDKIFPVQKLDWDLLRTVPPQKLAVTWIGHATCLLQMDGFNVLTDPMFSKRCAPTQFAGPARYRPTPCSIPELLEQLPIDVVAISHNHYDHLDYDSIKALVQHTTNPLIFVVPLGLKRWLRSNISKIEETHQIVELDWHESHVIHKNNGSDQTTHPHSLEVMPVPMQHWGSRIGFDRDTTLWCGFSLKSSTNKQSALFCGDTGWFEEIKEIGDKYGPYDLAMIPIGAYDPRDFMRPQHTNPEDAVEVFKALKTNRAVPIHWGTFQLTREPVMEPRERLLACLEKEGIEKSKFAPWVIGETVVVDPSNEK